MKPPTEKQLRYLRTLGYSGPEPSDIAQASQWITELEERRERRTFRYSVLFALVFVFVLGVFVGFMIAK